MLGGGMQFALHPHPLYPEPERADRYFLMAFPKGRRRAISELFYAAALAHHGPMTARELVKATVELATARLGDPGLPDREQPVCAGLIHMVGDGGRKSALAYAHHVEAVCYGPRRRRQR